MKARRKTGKRREKPKPLKTKLPRAGTAPKTPELTDAVVRRIVDALRKGAHLPTAVGSVGLDSAVMVSWLRAEGEPYETLRSLVRQALATCELDALTQAQLAAQDDKRLAFEWLRTRWPGKYAPQPMPVPQWDLGAFLAEAWEERRAELQVQSKGEREPSALQIAADASLDRERERLKELTS